MAATLSAGQSWPGRADSRASDSVTLAAMSYDDVWMVIPLYNEGAVSGDVVREARATFPHVVCVDDGSWDQGPEEASRAGAVLVRHPVNLGQGAALQTGFAYALSVPSMRWVVTF